jgi:argininosuccinate lyase
MNLWDKGISIDQLIEKFTVGNDREIDLKIAAYDIQASLNSKILRVYLRA